MLVSEITFDDSTIRKKLKEYVDEGLIVMNKVGRKAYYSRNSELNIDELSDVLDFFSEITPLGVIGSYLKDKLKKDDELFLFKHHYIMSAIDSEALATIFMAMKNHKYITVSSLNNSASQKLTLLPLKVYISAQNGRHSLLAYDLQSNDIKSLLIHNLTDVKIQNKVAEDFMYWRDKLKSMEKYMWGVSSKWNSGALEHLEFDICVNENEMDIVNRLIRERRNGEVIKLDDQHYRYSVDVYDARELSPWVRTFISYICRFDTDNKAALTHFKNDLKQLFYTYDVLGGKRGNI